MKTSVLDDLAKEAKAHIDAGGCSGDLCRKCGGRGWYDWHEKSRGVKIMDNCWACNKTGIGR